jgi:iron complex outermembrane receptor protein
MGHFICVTGAGLMLALLLAQTALAQDSGNNVSLPPIAVSSSRLAAGIVGTSTSVITSDEIEHSPAQSLPDILGQQAGVQIQHLFSGANGSHDTVDLRGFGAFSQSNVLVLVNGRRFQDFDLQGSIFPPSHSIASNG